MRCIRDNCEYNFMHVIILNIFSLCSSIKIYIVSLAIMLFSQTNCMQVEQGHWNFIRYKAAQEKRLLITPTW